MSNDPVMVILGVIGTLAVIALTLKMTGLLEPSYTKFEFKKDIIPLTLAIAIMFCVWYSLPFAWLRGRLFDPIFCIVGVMIMAFMAMTGCIESESAYRKRRNKR